MVMPINQYFSYGWLQIRNMLYASSDSKSDHVECHNKSRQLGSVVRTGPSVKCAPFRESKKHASV